MAYSICVFCGSRMGNDDAYRDAADTFARELAAREITLVYGGGNVGLMGVLADAALDAGGRVVGVIPDFLTRREVMHPGLSEHIVVDDLFERKAVMIERADAFVALPGGPGTLDETIEIITWRQLGLHGKPLVILNHEGYWRPLVDLLEYTIAQGFARESFRQLFLVVDHVEDVLPALASYTPPDIPSRPERV